MAVPRARARGAFNPWIIRHLDTSYEPLLIVFSSVMSLKEQFPAAFSKI